MFKEKALWIKDEIFSIITVPEVLSDRWTVFCPSTIDGINASPEAGPMITMARKLAEKGVASVRFDYRGKGNSYGDCKKFDYYTAVNDINEVIKYIKKEYKANDIRIYAKGGGGYAGGMVALQNSDISKALLYEPILAPADAKVIGFNDNIYDLADNEFGILKGVRVYGRHTRIMETLPSLDKIDIKNKDCNLLIMLGNKDEMTPAALRDKIIKNLAVSGISCKIKDKPPHDIPDDLTLHYLENEGIKFLAS